MLLMCRGDGDYVTVVFICCLILSNCELDIIMAVNS